MKYSILLVAAPILAHTLYVLPAKFKVGIGETLVFSVHNGDSFPASDEAVSPQRLLDCRLVSKAGATPVNDFRVLGRATHAVVKMERAGSHWLAVHTRSNLLSLDQRKFESYLKEEGLEWVAAWRQDHNEAHKPGRERYTKHAKSLIVAGAPDDGWQVRLGLDLEFIPESDPAKLKPGERLPVQLLWRGKPAANVRVERAWAAGTQHGVGIVGRTDANGRLAVPVDKAGRWRIHAVAMERVADNQEVDWESFWATLTFEVSPSEAPGRSNGVPSGI